MCVCVYNSLSPCIPLLKLNESSIACKCLSSTARINGMMNSAAGRLKALHGRLAALSGECVLLLRGFESEVVLETDTSTRHSWHSCDTSVCPSNVAH